MRLLLCRVFVILRQICVGALAAYRHTHAHFLPRESETLIQFSRYLSFSTIVSTAAERKICEQLREKRGNLTYVFYSEI